MLGCLGLVIVQLVNIQVVMAPGLRKSAFNPRNAGRQYDNQRGNIFASDGTLLAESVRSSSTAYLYAREYPQGSLYSQVVGYSSAYYGTAGIENQYNQQLTPTPCPPRRSPRRRLQPLQTSHRQPTLTIDPTCRQTAGAALKQIDGNEQGRGRVRVESNDRRGPGRLLMPTFDPECAGLAERRRPESGRLRLLQPEGL